MAIRVIINDRPYEFARELTFKELADALELKMEKIAIERKGEVVPRSTFDKATIKDKDDIEIVHFIGGG
jgi:sulfur carrier protein